MTDILNLQNSTDILNPNLNQDIVESLEKFTQSSITSKELKEKTIESIFLQFVNKLTLALQSNDHPGLADLFFSKSALLVEQTGKWEWPLVETLKVQNFDPLAISLYNYLKYKFLFKNKPNKELYPKAFDNLYLLIMKFMEKLTTPFTDEMLFALFNDFFDLYIKVKDSSEDLSELEEKIENLTMEVDETTNINNTLRSEIIEPGNHKEYIVGVLFLLFKIKSDCLAKGSAQEVFKFFKNLFRRENSDYLKDQNPTIHFEVEILLNISLFLEGNIQTALTNLVSTLKYLRLYRKFRKNPVVIDNLNLFENVICQLAGIFIVCSGLKINDYIKQFLLLNNKLVECLSVRETKGYENILTPCVNQYLSSRGLIRSINSQAENLRTKGADNCDYESILNIFYSNIISLSQQTSSVDLFSVKESINKQFTQMNLLLNK